MKTFVDVLVRRLLSSHPLPWRIEHDWTVEVIDANNRVVEKFMNDAMANDLIAAAVVVHANDEKGRAEVDALLAEYGIDP
jgi:hypothetical protein